MPSWLSLGRASLSLLNTGKLTGTIRSNRNVRPKVINKDEYIHPPGKRNYSLITLEAVRTVASLVCSPSQD